MLLVKLIYFYITFITIKNTAHLCTVFSNVTKSIYIFYELTFHSATDCPGGQSPLCFESPFDFHVIYSSFHLG